MSVDREDVSQAVGRRVREARTDRGWTLDRLAERSGVSRRMIVNIESGTANASLGTLLHLCEALGVHLADLVTDPSSESTIDVTSAAERQPLWHGPLGGTAELVATTAGPDIVELWDWSLESGEEYASTAHARGTRELIHVRSGQLLLTVGADERSLRAGDAASFPAHQAHAYANNGRARTRFTMTVIDPAARVRP